MPSTSEGTATASTTAALAEVRPNGMTDEQVRHLTVLLGSGKPDQEAWDRIFEDAAEVRRQLNAEFLRLMDAEGSK